MKRILVTMPSYEIGGITTSLYNLLSSIDPERLRVDLFAQPKGYYSGKMPNCNELPQNVWLSYPYVNGNIFIKIFQTIVYGARFLLSKVKIDIFPLIYHIGGKSLGSDKYDAVACFSEGQASTVAYYPAKKRIQWIHCDYRRSGAASNYVGQKRVYKKIDKVVCVSEFVKKVFSEIYPEYASKTLSIHNIIDTKSIIEKSSAAISDTSFDHSGFTIVSCGRLDPVKQFSLIPSIAARVKSGTNIPFKWYIIGGGDDEEKAKIESEIQRNGVEGIVVLLGMKDNPYKYMAKSNLYVCTSSSESFPMVVNEAKALGVPVISNDFPSVYESVEDGVDGYITTIDDMSVKIAEFMESPLKIMPDRIDNQASLDAIYKLFEV